MDKLLETGQFEKQIVNEALVKGVAEILNSDPRGTGTAAKERTKQDLKSARDKIQAVSYIQKTSDIAATGLDITRLSPQIMQRAVDSLGKITVLSEASNKQLPLSIDDYIALTFPTSDTRYGVDGYLTNTGRIIVIAQDMFFSAISVHPTLLKNIDRKYLARARSSRIIRIPETVTYKAGYALSLDDIGKIPTTTDLFLQNEKSIPQAFMMSMNDLGKRRLRGAISAGKDTSVDEAWDIAVHMITCLSNEMIISAGLGRLLGSALGNRFIERDTENPFILNPFIRVLGFNPNERAERVETFLTTGPDRAGSLLDFLALGEEVPEEKLVVMPFETNTVVDGSKPYVSGKKYFIDLAIQSSDESAATQRGALKRFSNDIGSFFGDMSSYMTELLALSEDTPLAPHLLTARILQDFADVLRELDKPESDVSAKSCFVAGMFVDAGRRPNSLITKRSTDVPGFSGHNVTIADALKISVVQMLREFDRRAEGSEQKLSNEKLVWEKGDSQNDPDLNFDEFLFQYQPTTDSDVFSTSPAGLRKPEPYYVKKYYRTFSGVRRSNNLYPLYDEDVSSKSNLINLVARFIREVQKEALNLAQRNSAKSDYRNIGKRTMLSNCDDDRFIDVVCDIYAKLAYLILPIGVTKQEADRRLNIFNTYVPTERVRGGLAVVTAISNSLINGSEVTSDAIQRLTGVDSNTSVNYRVVGDQTLITTLGAMCDSISRLTKHRYYIKSSMKILESIAAGVTASSAAMTQIFSILSNSSTIKRDKLKGPDATLYDMFVTEKEKYADVLEGLSEQQANLNAAAEQLYLSTSPVFLRKDIVPSRSERLALRDFIREVYGSTGIEDLQVISLGLRRGIIESLYRPAIRSSGVDGFNTARRGTEGQKRGNIVRIEVDRYDDVHVNRGSGIFVDALNDSDIMEFDPEIFVLPGSIAYDPDAPVTASTGVIDRILSSTTFYKIRSGEIIERPTVDTIETSKLVLYRNALVSYLLDLYVYETAGVRYLDGLSPYGEPSMSAQGLDLAAQVSSNQSLSRLSLCPTGFIDMFDATTRRMRTGANLRLLLAPRSVGSPPRFTSDDAKFAGLMASMMPLTSTDRIIANRDYERIYHFFYDESLVRNRIAGDTTARKRLRRKFDIYTLAFRVSYGA
jgi:hypothetical protein